MKKLLYIFTAGIFAMSCSTDHATPLDFGAEGYLSGSSFLVESYEVYNHDDFSTNDLAAIYDSVYMTFNAGNLYLTKVYGGSGSSAPTRYLIDTISADFASGALMGLWMNESDRFEINGFDRVDNTAGMEYSGRSADGNFESHFIKMEKLDQHPKGAQVASGLPG
ncbi:MAG: hypothetical protein RL754_342 [Bacteroidota bacterium]|jgi:hypothetical protein